jgi:hypothetical protein
VTGTPLLIGTQVQLENTRTVLVTKHVGNCAGYKPRPSLQGPSRAKRHKPYPAVGDPVLVTVFPSLCVPSVSAGNLATSPVPGTVSQPIPCCCEAQPLSLQAAQPCLSQGLTNGNKLVCHTLHYTTQLYSVFVQRGSVSGFQPHPPLLTPLLSSPHSNKHTPHNTEDVCEQGSKL